MIGHMGVVLETYLAPSTREAGCGANLSNDDTWRRFEKGARDVYQFFFGYYFVTSVLLHGERQPASEGSLWFASG